MQQVGQSEHHERGEAVQQQEGDLGGGGETAEREQQPREEQTDRQQTEQGPALEHNTPDPSEGQPKRPLPLAEAEQQRDRQPLYTPGLEQFRDIPTHPPSPETEQQSDGQPPYTPGLEQWRDNVPAGPPSEADQQSDVQPTPLSTEIPPPVDHSHENQMERERGEEQQRDGSEERDRHSEPAPPTPEAEYYKNMNKEQEESEPPLPHFHFRSDANRGFSFEEGEMECPPCGSLILQQAAALFPDSMAEWIITLVCALRLLHNVTDSIPVPLPLSLPRGLMLALSRYWPPLLLF